MDFVPFVFLESFSWTKEPMHAPKWGLTPFCLPEFECLIVDDRCLEWSYSVSWMKILYKRMLWHGPEALLPSWAFECLIFDEWCLEWTHSLMFIWWWWWWWWWWNFNVRSEPELTHQTKFSMHFFPNHTHKSSALTFLSCMHSNK